jgi:hypothetical protein
MGGQGVAEGDQPLPARGEDVLGVPGRVAAGDAHVQAGEDFLSVGYGARAGPAR